MKINRRTSFLFAKESLLSLFVMSVFSIASPAFAAPEMAGGGSHGAPEMTPGPRMIRAVDALGNDYLAAEVLSLSPAQSTKIRHEMRAFKTDIWRKEAVLLAMFEEVGIKRRNHLLTKGTYAATNQLTGGIETDEMVRMIKAIENLQVILTKGQKIIFQSVRRPELNLEHPEGFNTRIGLLALSQYRRAYGPYRMDLDLSDAQKVSLKNALEAARREVIQIGTEIEISRMEAYDLLKEPLIDTKKVTQAMSKTAALEGVFFPKLSEYSKRFKEILSPEQQVVMTRLKTGNRHRGRGARNGQRKSAGAPAHSFGGTAFHANRRAKGNHNASILERARLMNLSETDLASLVDLEISASRKLQTERVEKKVASLELDALIQEAASSEDIAAQIDRIVRHTAEIKRIQLEKRTAGLKILGGHEEVTFHMPY